LYQIEGESQVGTGNRQTLHGGKARLHRIFQITP
jgi:hypothetical protein